MKAPKWLRPYLPNSSTSLALVSREFPADAFWPIRLTQIVGGRTWSLSFVTHMTPTPVPSEQRLERLHQDIKNATRIKE